MSLTLGLLTILGLIVVAVFRAMRFWSKVTKVLARDEESIYGESLRSICCER